MIKTMPMIWRSQSGGEDGDDDVDVDVDGDDMKGNEDAELWIVIVKTGAMKRNSFCPHSLCNWCLKNVIEDFIKYAEYH